MEKIRETINQLKTKNIVCPICKKQASFDFEYTYVFCQCEDPNCENHEPFNFVQIDRD